MTTIIAVALISSIVGLVVGAWVAAHVEEQRRSHAAIREQLQAYGRGYRQAAKDVLDERDDR